MIGRHHVWVAGEDISCLVDLVATRYGRDDAGGQPEASTTTIDVDLTDTALPPTVEIGAPVEVTTTIGATVFPRFTGTLTDINLGWDDAGEQTPDAGVGQLIAVSPLADLGRRVVGDVPFPQELDGARVLRVLALAGIVPDPLLTDPGTVEILPRDIDSSNALEVIAGTAQSGLGILWETPGGAILYADSEHRRNAIPDLHLDACDVLVTPTWKRDLSGLINDVSIGYGPVPEDGEQARYTTDAPSSITRFGTYGYTTGTELATLPDAQALAGYLLARNSSPVWLMPDLPVDVASLDEADTVTLLGLTMHGLLALEGLPYVGAPTTVALWVEGWTETLGWDIHELELAVTGYCRTVPAPRWEDVDPAMLWDAAVGTWDDAVCYGPTLPGDTWSDVPASTRWETVPPDITWDTWQPVAGALDESEAA